MSERLTFAPWVRRGGRPVETLAGRALTAVGFDISDQEHTVGSELRFLQPGPGDVRGLHPGAMRQVVPPRGDPDAEEEHCPYVELTAEDLPWRYGLLDAQDRPVPWCVLVVGDPDDVVVQGDRVRIGTATQSEHDLAAAHLWAHVQRPRDGAVGSGFARVLSPVPMQPALDYTAALVVPWSADGAPTWSGMAEVEVPCLHSWSFRTGEAGTFEDLATALHAADLDPVGSVSVTFTSARGERAEMTVPGALTTIAFGWEPLPDGHPARHHDVLAAETDRQGRRYVQPPAYGAAWVGHRAVRDAVDAARHPTEQRQWDWTAEVNADLRLRTIAGVGLQAGIDLQEQIVAAADRQWGSGRWASELVSSLALGLAASEGLWRRRLPEDDAGRLSVLGPAAHRLPVTDHSTATSLAGALRNPEPGAAAYPVGLLGPQVARTVGRGRVQDAGGPGALQRRAGEGLPVPDQPRDEITTGTAEVDQTDAGHLDTLAHRAERGSGGATTPDEVDRRLEAAIDEHEITLVLGPAGTEAPSRPQPGRITDLLVSVLDPGGGAGSSAGRRVLGRLAGNDEEPLAPLRDCPDLDLPAWPYLRDVVPHWLLPGAESLEPGEVVAMRTCPEFVEAFLLGLNHRALGELAWRQHPVATGCTPLRRFWDAAPDPGSPPGAGEDIRPVRDWIDGSRLGTHAPAGVRAERLVVVVRSPLFRRYPRTLLYLAPNTRLDWTPGSAALDRPVMPRSVAAMSPDLTIFAFDVDPDLIATHWVVVQEMPEGIRFGRTATVGPGGDSADWASANLDTPLRVLLPGPETVGGSGP